MPGNLISSSWPDLFEQGADGKLYKAQVCVDKNGLIASHRKLHPFINPHLTPGNSYTVFDLYGWKCGILTCYDNNIIENVRATTLLGAKIIFMPHVTMCTPSPRPGAGFVDAELWKDKVANREILHREFDGLKGRAMAHEMAAGPGIRQCHLCGLLQCDRDG